MVAVNSCVVFGLFNIMICSLVYAGGDQPFIEKSWTEALDRGDMETIVGLTREHSVLREWAHIVSSGDIEAIGKLVKNPKFTTHENMEKMARALYWNPQVVPNLDVINLLQRYGAEPEISSSQFFNRIAMHYNVTHHGGPQIALKDIRKDSLITPPYARRRSCASTEVDFLEQPDSSQSSDSPTEGGHPTLSTVPFEESDKPYGSPRSSFYSKNQ